MEIFIAKVYPETIMIMWQWDSNAFLSYILIQVGDLIKGIIAFMKNKQAFYTIPEADIVYHTPVQDNTEPHRLNLYRRGQ